MSVTLLHVRYVSVTSVTQHTPIVTLLHVGYSRYTTSLDPPPITVTHVRYVSVTSVTSPLYPHTSVTFVTRSDLTNPSIWNETHCQVNSTGLTPLRQYSFCHMRTLICLSRVNVGQLQG